MPDNHQWTEPDLDSLIDGAVEEFRTASRIWDDAEAGAAINAFADRVAELLHTSAQGIAVKDGAELLRRISRRLATNSEFELYPQVVEALQLRLASEFLGDTRGMAGRCLELLTFAFDGAPKDQVARFLARVARCYILDLAAETSIFCRAALENALNEKYAATGTPWPRNDKGESPGPLRIQFASDKGWLSAAVATEAKEVWTRGSKSAHADPAVVTNARETVAATARVLEELYRFAAA